MAKSRQSSQRAPMLSPSTLPVLPDLNEEIYERAGITKDDRAQLLKRVFDKTVKRLSATHVKTFSHKGTVIYSDPLVDHATQGKAIDQAQTMIGLTKHEPPKVTSKATIHLPDWGTARSIGLNEPPTNVTPITTLDVKNSDA